MLSMEQREGRAWSEKETLKGTSPQFFKQLKVVTGRLYLQIARLMSAFLGKPDRKHTNQFYCKAYIKRILTEVLVCPLAPEKG